MFCVDFGLNPDGTVAKTTQVPGYLKMTSRENYYVGTEGWVDTHST